MGDEGLLNRLSARLKAEDDIVVAIAFGSVVSGTPRVDSDVDIAVLTRTTLTAERRRELVSLIGRATGRPVDLVDLQTAGVAVTRTALGEGRRLVCRDRNVLASLLSKILVDAADFLPYRERILSERRETWIR